MPLTVKWADPNLNEKKRKAAEDAHDPNKDNTQVGFRSPKGKEKPRALLSSISVSQCEGSEKKCGNSDILFCRRQRQLECQNTMQVSSTRPSSSSAGFTFL